MALLTGAVIASPVAGRAQQPMPAIGYLSVGRGKPTTSLNVWSLSAKG
jgi:hypothetical protein